MGATGVTWVTAGAGARPLKAGGAKLVPNAGAANAAPGSAANVVKRTARTLVFIFVFMSHHNPPTNFQNCYKSIFVIRFWYGSNQHPRAGILRRRRRGAQLQPGGGPAAPFPAAPFPPDQGAGGEARG